MGAAHVLKIRNKTETDNKDADNWISTETHTDKTLVRNIGVAAIYIGGYKSPPMFRYAQNVPPNKSLGIGI